MSERGVRSLFEVCEQVAVPLAEALGGNTGGQIRSMFPIDAMSVAERERSEYETRIATLQEARDQAVADCGRLNELVVAEVAQYAGAVARLQEATVELAFPSAEEAVALGLEVARAIIGRELHYDRGVMVRSVDEALRRVRKDDEVIVRLGPADAAALRQARPELFDGGGTTLVEDAELPVGGCLIETENRIVDASVDSRLEAAREALVEAVREARAAGIPLDDRGGAESPSPAPEAALEPAGEETELE